jgi:hypothetical protein
MWQSFLGSMSRDVHSCTHWLRPRNPPLCPRNTRALLVSKDRRHLFVTPLVCEKFSTALQDFACPMQHLTGQIFPLLSVGRWLLLQANPFDPHKGRGRGWTLGPPPPPPRQSGWADPCMVSSHTTVRPYLQPYNQPRHEQTFAVASSLSYL